jgi:hypothetical protein
MLSQVLFCRDFLLWQIKWGPPCLLWYLSVWCSRDRASWYISIVKPNRCTTCKFIEYHSTCFGQSFPPSSGVQDCTHSIRYMSYWNSKMGKIYYWVVLEFQYDIYLMLCVQSWTPDDGRKDQPKHVEWYSINLKIVPLVGFTIEMYLSVLSC